MLRNCWNKKDARRGRLLGECGLGALQRDELLFGYRNVGPESAHVLELFLEFANAGTKASDFRSKHRVSSDANMTQ